MADVVRRMDPRKMELAAVGIPFSCPNSIKVTLQVDVTGSPFCQWGPRICLFASKVSRDTVIESSK